MIRLCSSILVVLMLLGSVNPSFSDELEVRDLYYDEYRESLLLGNLNDPSAREQVSAPIPREQNLGTNEFL